MTATTKSRVRLTIIVTVAGLLVGAAWLQMRHLNTAATGATGSTGLSLYAPEERVRVPQVTGKSLDGVDLDLAQLRGHVVVLNVWGSWCAPCRAEAPDLARVSRETASDGVRFVGIDVRDNTSAARAFADRFGIEYPSFNDANGLVLAQFAGLIPVSAVPSTLVIGADGMVRARIVGRVDPTTLRGLISDAQHQP